MKRFSKKHGNKTNTSVVAILSLIIALVSILANIATTYINNRTQEILKDTELSYSYKVKGYIDFSEAVNTILTTNRTDEFSSAEQKLRSSQIQLSLYLNGDLGDELERYVDQYFEEGHFKLLPMVEKQSFDDKETVKRMLIINDLVKIQNILRNNLLVHKSPQI